MTINDFMVTGMLSTTEILVIAAVILVIFGGSAIPKFARSLGKAKSEFEKGLKEGMDESDKNTEKDQAKKP